MKEPKVKKYSMEFNELKNKYLEVILKPMEKKYNSYRRVGEKSIFKFRRKRLVEYHDMWWACLYMYEKICEYEILNKEESF